MNHINRLLDLLYSWVPLSASFRLAIKPMLQSQHVQARAILLDPPSHTLKVWYSVDCFIAAYAYDAGGQEHVERIYLPNDLFTDLFSFFGNKPARLRLVVVEGQDLLFIKKEDFMLLKSFTDTSELVQYKMLAEHEIESWRAWVMTLSDSQKVYQFSLNYPIHLLPNHVCASFLQMTPSRFSAHKALLNRRK